MNYFNYPLDTKSLLRKKIAIKAELLSNDTNWIDIRVAILGGSTTNEIVEQLELFLLYNGIRAEFYQSEFGLYWEDAMFGNVELEAFTPDIIYIHTSWRNITAFPEMSNIPEEVERLIETEYKHFASMWETLKKKYACPIIQNNFERPNYRLMGNRDIWDYRGRSNFITRLNQLFYEYAQSQSTFYINDIDYIAQDFGLSEWGNSIYWNMYKYACCLSAIPYVAQNVSNIIKSIYGKNKKVLALDLDNTLWGGTIGDDGVDGIKIGLEMPNGEVYYEFQKYCKCLQQIGVILVINSKNEMMNALEGLNHPEGVLRKEDFVSIKANWNAKDQNLYEIAEELSLGVDSFVFVDDNPAEREIVRGQIPYVETPSMDEAENYIRVLDHSGYFEVTALSNEDIYKTEQYHARTKVNDVQTAFEDYNEYLTCLQMKAIISDFEPIAIQRIAQLTNKSNQFNLTTLRCNEDDIRTMQSNQQCICFCGRLIDKFADNGIVTVVVGEITGFELNITLWLMSCRVLKRGLEHTMMNILITEARRRGIDKVIGYYYPTKKNGMVNKFYEEMGFHLISEDENGNTKWMIEVDNYIHKEVQIVVEMQNNALHIRSRKD